MKGLLIKDLYMMTKYLKMFILIDAAFIAVAFFSPDNVMFLLFPVLTSGVLPVTLQSLDERCKWTEYSGTLPYSKTQIVSEKYIVGLLLPLATSLLIFVIMVIKMSVSGTVQLGEAALMVCFMFMISLALPALCLPFCFKFGVEKGRIAYYVVIAAFMALGTITGGSVTEAAFSSNNGVVAITFAAMAAVYVLSWILSATVCKPE